MAYGDDDAGQTHDVGIQAMRFDPAALTIATGDTVVWTNHMGLPHTVTPDNGEFAGSGPLAKDATFSHRFDTPGTVHYHCEIHPHMTGSVVVT